VPIELVPTVATVHRILERHGRTGRRRRAQRRFHAGRPETAFDQPNGIWTADFKGQFRTGNGVYCYPLTVQDGATRFLLGCRGLVEPTIEASWPVFVRLLGRYGLPGPRRSGGSIGFGTATTPSGRTRRSASACPRACTRRPRGRTPLASCRSRIRGIMKCGALVATAAFAGGAAG